jgi:hypothetical protein
MSEEIKRIRDDEFAVSPHGIHIGHTRTEVDYLLEIIEREQGDDNRFGFVEVGVHVGGLADAVIRSVPNYLGLEIDGSIINVEIKAAFSVMPQANFWIRDAWAPATISDVSNWMVEKKPVFIYCDGGEKPIELDLYSKIVRSGDLIGVHDYGTYEGAEIEPAQADRMMQERGFVKYFHSFDPPLVRIQVWRRR